MPKKSVRLSLYNKINSVIRSNQYKKELETILSHWPEHYIKKELDSLAKKWGLPHIMFFPDTGTVSYSAEDNAVQVIPYKNRNARWKKVEKSKHYKGEKLPITMVGVGSMKRYDFFIDRSPELEEERYLTLRIDLKVKKDVLMDQFEEKIDTYRKCVKLPKNRERESTYDPWVIHNLRSEGKTYEEIIKIIDPTKNKNTLLTRADVARKAYKKACEMVEDAKPIG